MCQGDFQALDPNISGGLVESSGITQNASHVFDTSSRNANSALVTPKFTHKHQWSRNQANGGV